MNNYNVDKFIRIRGRAQRLSNDSRLAYEDVQEHQETKHACEVRLREIEKAHYPNRDSYEDSLNRTKKDLEQINELLGLARAEYEVVQVESNRMNTLVTQLEKSIRDWGHELPANSRVNSFGGRRVSQNVTAGEIQ
ncbi:MAG: hypothetical protein JKY88_06660 [Pseudomonadales bacterium]|nr:hypothetical protein [Pseudomonadales bacterium]